MVEKISRHFEHLLFGCCLFVFKIFRWLPIECKCKILKQLERLRSEDTLCRLMITHTIESCWIPSQNKVEWPWIYRSRAKFIICTKYGKNPSGTVDATERTRFSRPRPNDLEDIGQGQRSLLYATHTLILVNICAKYSNMARIHRELLILFQGQGRKISKICQKKTTRHTL